MEQFSYRVTDPAGIHARPAGLIVKEAAKFKSDTNGKEADAKKIFAVMSLGIRSGDEMTITAEGSDEAEAKNALAAVIGEHL